jgi:hypothetical protein
MSNEINDILKQSGTSQPKRFLEALDPTSFDLHDFSLEDWVLFAYNFAQHVNYFHINDDQNPSNNWQNFFKEFNKEDQEVNSRTDKEYGKLTKKIEESLTQYKEEQNLTPHLTLFVCFLQLLEFSKQRFNKLTKRHLDFYYNEILQVDKRAPLSDQVHILFEIAKRSSEELIEEGTELNADKDADGNPLIYKTEEDIVVNKTQIASLKTVYNGKKNSESEDDTNNPFEFKAGEVANTMDGLEEPLSETAPYWYPFGYTSAIVGDEYKELNNAEVGFAISSPMLRLKEGKRTVTITIQFKADGTPDTELINTYTKDVLKGLIKIYASSEEKWIGPLTLKTEEQVIAAIVPDAEADDGIEVLVDGSEEELVLAETPVGITQNLTDTQLVLAFELAQEDKPIVDYNEEFLLEKYDTTAPVVRFLIDTESQEGYKLYRRFSEKIVESITIHTKVEDAAAVMAENDTGVLNTAKPFYPFTAQPKVGSNFIIDYPEVFEKNWSEIEVKFNWKNAPESFYDWYSAYMKSQLKATPKQQYVDDATATVDSPDVNREKIVSGDSYFRAKKAIQNKDIWNYIPDFGDTAENESLQTLFTKIQNPEDDTQIFECVINYENKSFEVGKAGPIRLTLQKDFLHAIYPRLYAIALMSWHTEMPIPNEPYTPIGQNMTISYTAQEKITVESQLIELAEGVEVANANKQETFDSRRIQLFHEHPFGQAEEHNYLSFHRHQKGIIDGYERTYYHTHLVPKYCSGGSLFIGLENVESQQTISMLAQVLEGSENPLVSSFEDNEEIDWSVLCENGWKNLKEYIVSNNTDNFLTSGIIKISLPREATQDNTILPENFVWLKASMHKTYDAVCKVLDLHTQAVPAKLYNNNNNVSHLENGLPAETIKKLITRVPQIKSVKQPYNSFDGTPEESDENFYRRISERLRHKNRAITLWDYEHLILQKYPEIYKVKCLNHTSETSFNAAGSVTLIAIPDTVNKNVFDIHEPRVSKGLLNKAETYINTLNSLHVNAKVINPNYEKVYVKLEVQFHEGYDKSFYTKQLDEDIIKFLSPWAYDDTKEVEFGVTLHKSVLIDYLEKLDYVDYLQNVEIKKGSTGKAKASISPSDPKSILVSAKSHDISTVMSDCKGDIKQIKKICQV